MPIGEAKDYFNYSGFFNHLNSLSNLNSLNNINSFNNLNNSNNSNSNSNNLNNLNDLNNVNVLNNVNDLNNLNFNFYNNLKNIRNAEKTIDKIIVNIPEIDGVQIKLLRVSFNKRTFFPLDCYINYFFKNYIFNHSGPYFITIFKTYNNIFRLITPVYLFIIFFIISFGVYKLIYLNSFRPNFFTFKHLSKNSKNKSNINININTNIVINTNTNIDTDNNTDINTNNTNFLLYYISFSKSISIILICFLIIFSLLFIQQGIFTLKSYWDSYKSFILEGNLSSTYTGFYNIREFLSFAKESIEKDIKNIEKDMNISAHINTSTITDANNINIIVLVKGQPVYIMAEFAYNLYPANIKFINISGKSSQEIINEILKEYKQDLSQNLSQNASQIKKYTKPISAQNYNIYNKYNISQLNNSQSNYYQYKQKHNYLVILDNNYLKSKDILKQKEFKLIAKYRKDYGLIYAFNIHLYQK